MSVRILFVEPPKDYWFLMGEYLPPPTMLLSLAAYVERELDDVEIEVLDCQAEGIGWNGVEKRISSYAPNIVASSAFTCNTYACVRVVEVAKIIDPNIVTVVGGQHFSFTAEESLTTFPEIDYVVRGEGEQTLVELIRALENGKGFSAIDGLSFRTDGRIIHNPPRSMIENLDSLPFPAYHLVEKNLNNYNFKMMAGKSRYLIVEGSRGCWHRCTFCTQWCHWEGQWRTKSAGHIADEMVHLRDDYGAEFIWFTDDNFELGKRGKELAQELGSKDFNDSIPWFFQARMDDIVRHPDIVSMLHDAGNNWQLLGVENNSPQTLRDFNKNEDVEEAAKAINILKNNGILAQAMFIIGSRRDTSGSISELRDFALGLDTDLAIFAILTPFPGTEFHHMAERLGWIEDSNYAHYDMIHAIMPTETLTRKEVQDELLDCYHSFYGSPLSIVSGLFSRNELKKRAYRHLAGKRVLHSLRQLV
jgi:anaerobic magnesium-protoporphyrin IX monomethyl ester cyclase